MVKTESTPPKMRNKKKVSTFTVNQHNFGSPSYSHQRRKSNKGNPDKKQSSHFLQIT